jgi:hypothetical protein
MNLFTKQMDLIINYTWPLIILLCLVIILILLLKKKRVVKFPYIRQPSLLTKSELFFYESLKSAVDENSGIAVKVRMADILKVDTKAANKKYMAAFNRIARKHVDFVIYNKSDFFIQQLVELDDKSHDLPERKQRDYFVDQAMQAAGIKIIHIKTQKKYNKEELKKLL